MDSISILEFFRLVFIGSLGISGIVSIFLAPTLQEARPNRAGVVFGLGSFATNAMSGYMGQALLGLTAATCFAIVVMSEAAKKSNSGTNPDSDTAKSKSVSFFWRLFWN